MPGNYNRIILVGNLTKDPELRKFDSGAEKCTFGLAVSRKRKDDEETLFVTIIAWEKLAQICGTYLKKGSSVLIEGRLTMREYEDKDGIKRKTVEVVAESLQMLDKKPGGEYGGAQSYGGRSQSFDADALDPEIPF